MDPLRFYCPSDNSHCFILYHDFRQHLIKCRLLQDKTAYICKYNFRHMFLAYETRDLHELRCTDKEPDPYKQKAFINSIRLGMKQKETILSSKFDENRVFPEENSQQNHTLSSNNHVILTNNNTNSLNNKINSNINLSFNNKYPLNYNENLNISHISLQDLPIAESMDPALRKIKTEKLFNSSLNLTKTAIPPPISQKLESLVHTLIFDNDNRLEIIVRRRSTISKLKMKEFSITEFKNISSFHHIINENFSQEIYENQYFVGEYTLYGDQENKIQLYGQFLNRFESGEKVAVNNYYKDTHNEVLLICTNKTRFLGDFIKKGDISILLFKYTFLYDKVRITEGNVESCKSPWVEPLRKEFEEFNFIEKEFIKKERKDDESFLSYKKELLEGKYKNPFHFYHQNSDLMKEEIKKQESAIDIEIEELQKKCEEFGNLLTKKTDEYKNKLNELELENQKKKNEIKQYNQINALLDKNKLDHVNDLNNHDLLYKEDKKQFEIKFNEELRKQKEKYHEIYRKRVIAYEGEIFEKKLEFPIKEKEYDDFVRDFDDKKGVFNLEEKKFNEMKGKFNEMKKNYDKLINKENFLEMHKKFKNSLNIADDSEYDQDKCNICLKERRNVVYLPCRHFVACEKCLCKAKEQGVECCLSCKREVKQIKKIKWD